MEYSTTVQDESRSNTNSEYLKTNNNNNSNNTSTRTSTEQSTSTKHNTSTGENTSTVRKNPTQQYKYEKSIRKGEDGTNRKYPQEKINYGHGYYDGIYYKEKYNSHRNKTKNQYTANSNMRKEIYQNRGKSKPTELVMKQKDQYNQK